MAFRRAVISSGVPRSAAPGRRSAMPFLLIASPSSLGTCSFRRAARYNGGMFDVRQPAESCPMCGATTEQGAIHCRACGEPLSVRMAPEKTAWTTIVVRLFGCALLGIGIFMFVMGLLAHGDVRTCLAGVLLVGFAAVLLKTNPRKPTSPDQGEPGETTADVITRKIVLFAKEEPFGAAVLLLVSILVVCVVVIIAGAQFIEFP